MERHLWVLYFFFFGFSEINRRCHQAVVIFELHSFEKAQRDHARRNPKTQKSTNSFNKAAVKNNTWLQPGHYIHCFRVTDETGQTTSMRTLFLEPTWGRACMIGWPLLMSSSAHYAEKDGRCVGCCEGILDVGWRSEVFCQEANKTFSEVRINYPPWTFMVLEKTYIRQNYLGNNPVIQWISTSELG